MIFQALVVIPFLCILAAVFGPPTKWETRAATPTERFVFRSALGLGILAYSVLGLGLAGALSRGALGSLLAILSLVALAGLLGPGTAFLRRLSWHKPASRSTATAAVPAAAPVARTAGGRPSPPPRAEATVSLAIVVGVLALLMALGCASPPTGMDWDGLSYHLADPKIFLQAGRIAPLPWEHHSNFPFTVEMLFTFGLASGSVAFAKAFHLAMGLLTAAGLGAAYLRLRRPAEEADPYADRVPGSAALLPTALFLGAPLVFWEGTVAYIDLGATLYAFLSVFAFTVAMDSDLRLDADGRDSAQRSSARWLLLSGILMGIAIGCKTTNGILLILLLGWGAWESIASGRPGRQLAALLLRFLVPAALIASPWFIKSYLWTGNPVYPFFYGLFGGRYWNADLARTYAIEQGQFGMNHGARGLAAFLLLPWNLTFHADAFSKGIGQFASFGPFALALVPLLVLARPLPRWVTAYLLLTLGYVVIWFGLSQQVRYLLPLLPLLCLVATYAVENATLGRAGRIAVGTFIGAALLMTVVRGYIYVEPMIPIALGAMAPEAYLDRTFQLAQAVRFVNHQLPSNAKLLLIEETRGFYFDRPYMWGNPGHHTLIPWNSFQTPEEMAAWMRAHGFTHLLLNSYWMRPGWGSSPWEALIVKGIQEGLLHPVFAQRSRGVAIFEIQTVSPAQGRAGSRPPPGRGSIIVTPGRSESGPPEGT